MKKKNPKLGSQTVLKLNLLEVLKQSSLINCKPNSILQKKG